MSSMKKIKKALVVLTLTILVGVLFTPVANIANAGDWDWFYDAFSFESDQEISFTKYAGEQVSLPATVGDTSYNETLTASSDLKEYIRKIVNFALTFLGLLSVLIVIYGGVLYVTAAGEDERSQKGKKAITYAVIGLLIVMGSYAFVNTIIKGATEGAGGGSTTESGIAGGAFNASSEQVRTAAINIFSAYKFLEESAETLKGIVNDTQKDSLLPQNNPGQTDVINFLTNTKGKLVNMELKTESFSTVESEINKVIREIDVDLDSIRRLDGEEFLGKWQELHTKYSNTASTSILGNILELIKEDFTNRLLENIENVEATYDEVRTIEALGPDSTAEQYFNLMKEVYEQDIIPSITTINIDPAEANVSALGANLLRALEAQSRLYEEMKNLKYVKARLTVDIVEGNAPLSVLFDTLGTQDPAGGSIQGPNILWDLSGTQRFEDLTTAPPINDSNATLSGNVILPNDGSMTCDFAVPSGETEEDFIGTTAKRCTFLRPGTYTAAVKIKSNDSTQYAPGISIITIKVHPPTTKIELDMTAGGTTQTIMHYEGDVLSIDRQVVSVTLEEAEAGISFDATETSAEKYKWNFGNGDIEEFSTSGTVERYKGYDEVGKYEVDLEVLSSLGVIDHKLFTLEVAGVAARLNAKPSSNVFINTPVTFDGSDSKSDLGEIKEYSWVIAPTAGQILPPDIADAYPVTQSGSTIKKLTHTFEYPLEYDITLTVTDSDSLTATDTIKNFRIESKTPVAIFDYEIQNSAQPATVNFNGTKSYDPDGTDEYLLYEWTVNPDENESTWTWENGTSANSQSPIIKFREKGDYEVTLKVTDSLTQGSYSESDKFTKTIEIDNVLDVAWAEDQDVTAVINDEGMAQIRFKIESETAIAYEIDFGDGDASSGDITFSKSIAHSYTESGKFEVKVTVYDEEDNDNTIKRRVFIGGGEYPIAKMKLLVDGTEILDLTDIIEITRADILKFDGSDSKNIDGSGRNLRYSWDFGDTEKSSKKDATHSYGELSPSDPGYFIATLTVLDKDDPELTAEDEVRLKVVSKAPKFSSLQAVPKTGGDLVTPVTVNMEVLEAEDPDGEIIQYKWWYFDINDPDNPLGLQITTQKVAQILIGTNGKEGEERTYGFGVEVTDSDNMKVTSTEILDTGQIPAITVENGPNDLPAAKFSVSATKVFVGDKVVFTSSSKDPDGSIISYVWDFEGDGFFNNEPTTESSMEHFYEDKNLNGYEVRLKVVDDKGGEAVSSAVRVFVDSKAQPPVAAFQYSSIEGSNEVEFINNSTVDEDNSAKISRYTWDFDINSDSNGDGITNNDEDSNKKSPSHEYPITGTYEVLLTIVDNLGGVDDVVQQVNTAGGEITTPETNLEAILITTPAPDEEDENIYLEGDSGSVIFDFIQSEGEIAYYIIDKNIYFDTDGDGVKNNDEDFKTALPGRWTTNFEKAWGRIVAKLTVVDTYDNEDSIQQEIKFK